MIKIIYYLSIAEAKQRCNTEALQHKHHNKNSEVHRLVKLLSMVNKILWEEIMTSSFLKIVQYIW
jgi:hypothetical protein